MSTQGPVMSIFNRIRALENILATLCLAMLPVIGACDTEVEESCVKGQACICEDDCSEACEGDGCGFTCEPGATCDFSCPEGGCAVECGEGTTCDLDCPGGTCTMSCAADAACNVTDCAGGSCVLSCNAASATCENACGIEQGCVSS